jgi:hypothetical protein
MLAWRVLAFLAIAAAVNVLLWAVPAWRGRGEGGAPFPTADECLDRLRRACWSIGETVSATRRKMKRQPHRHSCGHPLARAAGVQECSWLQARARRAG